MSKRHLLKVVIEVLVSLTFIFSVTFTLLHAYGFRYDILDRSFVKRTIVDLPGDLENVSISFDGKYLADQAPYQIFNVKPGRHNLQVEKENYYTWSENLYAQEDIVSSFPDLYLFPKNMEDFKTVVKTDINYQDVLLENANVFLLKDGKKDQEVNLKNGALEPIRTEDIARELEKKKQEYDAAVAAVKLLLPKYKVAELKTLYHPSINRKFVYISFTNGSKGIYELTDKELRLIDDIKPEFYDFTDNGARLLYSNGFDVKVYDVLEDEVILLSRFSQNIDLLQWYEDKYFIYEQANDVFVCDQPLKHCYALWQGNENGGHVKKLDYLPSDNLWVVVKEKEILTYVLK